MIRPCSRSELHRIGCGVRMNLSSISLSFFPPGSSVFSIFLPVLRSFSELGFKTREDCIGGGKVNGGFYCDCLKRMRSASMWERGMDVRSGCL